jgi:hypothetical protein
MSRCLDQPGLPLGVEKTHPADVAGEAALTDEIGEYRLLDRGGMPMDERAGGSKVSAA